MGWAKGGVVAVVASLVFAGAVGAQDSNETLKKEVEALKAKVEALEKAPALNAPQPGEQRMEGNWLLQAAEKLLKESKLSGFVDAGYTFNLNRNATGQNGNVGDGATPPGPTPALNGASVRAFDRRTRSFYLHNAQLELGRAPTKDMIAGFNVQLSTGSDPNVFGTADSDLTDHFDVQEAYVNILAPFGEGVDIKIGKFATLSGYEVIESKDNYNYSRSLGFLFAIPFTHTGIRAAYQPDEMVKVTLGVNNGWDVAVDNNDAKTLEFQLAVTPIKWLSLYGTFYYGAEKSKSVAGAHEPGDKRMLLDIVAVATEPGDIKGLTLGLNFDIGEEEDSAVSPTTGAISDAEWQYWAIYAKYALNDKASLAARIGGFNDKDGFRADVAVNGNQQEKRIQEYTITGEYKLAADLILRLEVRMDSSNEDVFLDGKKEDDSQVTLGAEVIFTF